MIHILTKQVFTDFDSWFEAFSANAPMRIGYGSQGCVVFHDHKNPTEAYIYFKWESRERFQDFLKDPVLNDKMEAADAGIPRSMYQAFEVEG